MQGIVLEAYEKAVLEKAEETEPEEIDLEVDFEDDSEE